MPIRQLLAAGLWVTVTVAATALVWMATSVVASEVTDRPARVVARGEVVQALESGAVEADTAPGIVAPGASPSAPAPPSAGPGSGPAAPNPGVTGPSGSASPPPTVVTTIPSATPTPTIGPASPPPTAPPGRSTATYSNAGGMVTVACSGSRIDLVSATAKNGYAARVVTGGPSYVEVHFVRGRHDVPIWAFCMGGEPVRVDSLEHRGPGWPPPGFP